jgi:DNA-binding transcriptional LysR family regulator
MAVEAAVHGMGIGLIPQLLVEDELRQGTLVQLTPDAYPSDRSYYLIYPAHKAENAALTAFAAWLEAEARDYRVRAL